MIYTLYHAMSERDKKNSPFKTTFPEYKQSVLNSVALKLTTSEKLLGLREKKGATNSPTLTFLSK